jgi:uncharacterized membrane protein
MDIIILLIMLCFNNKIVIFLSLSIFPVQVMQSKLNSTVILSQHTSQILKINTNNSK